jgi:hypothetical protein
LDSRIVAEAPTLFFDSLVNEEVQEMNEYSRIIQTQDREIAELKNTNNEMESRLEYQARERLELEGTLEDKEDVWAEKCRQLEQVRDENMKALQAEKTTNRKLWDLVYAKEKEIQRAYQRKYDGPSQQGNRPGPPQRGPSDKSAGTPRNVGLNSHRSPHDFLEARGSPQTVQERTAMKTLQGFFGL